MQAPIQENRAYKVILGQLSVDVFPASGRCLRRVTCKYGCVSTPTTSQCWRGQEGVRIPKDTQGLDRGMTFEFYFGEKNVSHCFGDHRHRKGYKPQGKTSFSITPARPENCCNSSPCSIMSIIKTIVVLAAAALVVGVATTPGVNKRAVCCLITGMSRTIADAHLLHRKVVSNPRTTAVSLTVIPVSLLFPAQQTF